MGAGIKRTAAIEDVLRAEQLKQQQLSCLYFFEKRKNKITNSGEFDPGSG